MPINKQIWELIIELYSITIYLVAYYPIGG